MHPLLHPARCIVLCIIVHRISQLSPHVLIQGMRTSFNAFRQLSEAKQRSMRYTSGEKKSYTKITFECTIELFRPIAQRDVIHSEILGVVSL